MKGNDTMNDDEVFDSVDKLLGLQDEIKSLSSICDKLKESIKEYMQTNNLSIIESTNGKAVFSEVAPTKIADTAKMKEDGIFDKYSKIKNGYTTLKVTRI